jgi:hypothetical protein
VKCDDIRGAEEVDGDKVDEGVNVGDKLEVVDDAERVWWCIRK